MNGDGTPSEGGEGGVPGDIAWNFAGIFVFDKEGTCVGRYSAELADCDWRCVAQLWRA